MFVVYHVITAKIVGSKHRMSFKTEGAANAHLTRMGKMGYRTNEYDVCSRWHYDTHVAKTVTKRNLMTNEEYQEDINTPLCCSPASETYWSQ
jgi:hypothetical protein